ncbi:MAG TPA: hypothetical protein VIL00_01910 [Pseudonocardiaceae bacterium]
MPSRPTTVLVHSPFLGPTSLRPLAAALLRRGWPALVPDLRPGLVEPPVHQRLARVFAEIVGTTAPRGELVLVGHSGAGPLLPGLAAAVDHVVPALVLLDAGLPTPGRPWSQDAPRELVEQLRAAATDGRLPRWNRWFEVDPLAELIDDDAVRTRVAAELPEVPAVFLEEPRPDVSWPGRVGYLLLSTSAYGATAAAAHRRGWPVRHVASHHLAPTADPEPVADGLLDLLGELLPV